MGRILSPNPNSNPNCLQECVEASNGKLSFAAQNKESEGDTTKHEPQDITSEENGSTGNDVNNDKASKPATDGNVDENKEVSVVGAMKMDTFLNYLRAMPGGLWTGFLMLGLFTATQASVLATIAAVGKWSVLPAENQWSRPIIGTVLGLVAVVLSLAVFRAFLSFHLTIQASKRLHDDMTRSVLRAKIEFFDTNPLGRILNRFSGDVGSNDDLLPNTLFDFLVVAFLVLGALVSAVSVLPVTLVFIPPLGEE